MRCLFVIDPPSSLNVKKDSTLAMIEACHAKSIDVAVCEPGDIEVEQGEVFSNLSWLASWAPKDIEAWYSDARHARESLHQFDIIFMRKDPPYDMRYLHITHLLALLEERGVRVENNTHALQAFNEKCSILQLNDGVAPTIVTANYASIVSFLETHGRVVIKPLDGMGGQGIFLLQEGDPNLDALIQQSIKNSQEHVMVQQYIPEIVDGDKRILIVHGEPIPYALARVPGKGHLKGNLAAGGHGEGRPLTKRDLALCALVKPLIDTYRLNFVGIDVIGDYITEINITSPTCIREITKASGIDVAGKYIEGFC